MECPPRCRGNRGEAMVFFPGSPRPGRCRIQIPVDRLWVKWFLFRRTDFQQKQFEGEDRGRHLGASCTWTAEEGPALHYFLLGNDAFALIPWMVKPHNTRQLTREERIANYRISRGRRVVENAFGILVSQISVLLGTMEQRPRVVRYCVYVCGVAQHAEDTPGRGRQGTNPRKWCSGPTKWTGGVCA